MFYSACSRLPKETADIWISLVNKEGLLYFHPAQLSDL